MAAPATSSSSPASSTRQFVHTLPNGLTLVAEVIPDVRSAAMSLLLPAGAATDPDTAGGSANVLSDWLLRGAGSRDARALAGYLDSLGVQRGAAADTVFLRFSAAMLAKNLLPVLPVYADILQRPHLPEDGFGPAIDLTIQQIESVEDEPSQKLGLLLRQQHYGYPFGRPAMGVKAQLETLTADALRQDAARRIAPQGAILAVAGAFDFAALKGAVEEAFGSWKGPAPALPPERPALRGVFHQKADTNQVQIGLAFETVRENEPDSILVHAAISVLSGGMGARLFTEIREKQGLCYSVQAGYHSLKDRAAIFGYSGTAPDRAQRTLDSFFVELKRLAQGVTREELDRAVIGMKSRVIMQGDSSSARAGAIAYDFHHRGRPRTLAELRAQIESITLEKVNAYLAANPVNVATVVTVGPEALTIPKLGM